MVRSTLTEGHRERVITMSGYGDLPSRCWRTKRGPAPLFPGYLFCLITLERGWWTARGTIGVRSIVGSHIGEPARVPDLVIAGLRAREKNGVIVLPKVRSLERGDKVAGWSRPLANGSLAIFDGTRPPPAGRDRATMLGAQAADRTAEG